MSKPVGLLLLASLLILAPACQSGASHAEALEGDDPEAKVEALLYFAEQEAGDLEPETEKVLLLTLGGGERNPMVRATAAYVLGELGEAKYVEPLTKALKRERDKDGRWDVRFDCVIALAKIGDERCVAPLVDALENDTHAWVRFKAARGLAAMKANAAIPALVDALSDPDPAVSFNAHRALKLLTGQNHSRSSPEWSKLKTTTKPPGK